MQFCLFEYVCEGYALYRQMLNHFALLQRLFSHDTMGVSLSSLVYFYFSVPGERIPQISLAFLAGTKLRAQDLEHSHAQKEWSTNAEVGHVSKHLRFLETTTSKAHSPHHGEIKARWRSGLSFKYFWVYEGGGRWEAEFWNGTRRRPNLPRPKGDSKQVCTYSRPSSGQDSHLLKSSLSEDFHHFFSTVYTFSK